MDLSLGLLKNPDAPLVEVKDEQYGVVTDNTVMLSSNSNNDVNTK